MRRRGVQIVCTIGPASREPEVLERLIDAGMSVARVNFAHGSEDQHRETIQRILEQCEQHQIGTETKNAICTPQSKSDLWEVDGCGMHFTMIRRDVLEAIPFRTRDQMIANDWYFAIDAREKGFSQAHDCSVVCGHIHGYRTLWPDVMNGWRADEEKIDFEELLNMADGKYIALTTLDMGDRFVKPGGEVELADEVAKVLLRKRAIKPAEVSKSKARKHVTKEVKHGTNN